MKLTAIAFTAVVLVVAISIVLLVTGGGPTDPRADDPTGDVVVGEGKNPPKDVSVVDIDLAEVSHKGSDIIFEAAMATEIPKKLPAQAMTWRWEVHESGQMTWIVSANVDLGPNVSIVATERNYASSTVDETLPGEITLEGTKLVVRLSAAEIEGFPQTFDWLLKTSLDGSRIDAKSAVAEDLAPDGGTIQLEE